ncbi:MAG: BCCT family transporter [Rubrobacter sp.]|nr:BCCT family transporter [Rubrobacter sp.]
MVNFVRQHTNPPVFIISLAVLAAFTLFGALFTGVIADGAGAIQGFIVDYFGWLYIIGVSFMLIFVVFIGFSRYGRIKLGPDDSRPEFSNTAWFAMLFTAGMGIGLVFWGVGEPVFHFQSPPVGEAETEAAAQNAMNYTFFHWGLHPWAVYILLGLSLGYAAFRRGLPLRPSSIFYPIIGDRAFGPIGNSIDILAVFGTIFGLATSLGLGATQINFGLNFLFGVSEGAGSQIAIVGVITAVALISVMLGIHGGIRRLALINLVLAVILAAFVLIAGPTLYLLNSLATNVGYYVQNLPQTSFSMYTYAEGGAGWLGDWTLFYWAWWISWSPFVGMFIARISYGRSIRQFVAVMLLAPSGASFVWFTIFGNTALSSLMAGEGGGLASLESDARDGMFALFSQLPLGALGGVLSFLAIIVVALFFITSSDSGSLVVDILTNGGDPNPIWQTRSMWAIIEGAVAAVLLGAGGLIALQTASLIAGLPLTVVLLLMCYALLKALQQEQLPARAPDALQPPEPGRAATRPRGTPAPQQVRSENPQDSTRS